MTAASRRDHTRVGGSSERLYLDRQSPWWGEHRCRYRFALPFAAEVSVLDIACGTGFGASMLTEANARHVACVDIDPATVAQAQRSSGQDRAAFLAADGTQLPFRTASFDLITSFETLEHITAAAPFVTELRRVLIPTGLLVLSTPNRDYTELNGHVCTNPFHVREYSRHELCELLTDRFSRVELLGQRLKPEYRLSPFESDHQRLYQDLGSRLRLFWWKIQNKLPFPLKDGLSRLFARHPFYPSDTHYEFTAQSVETAPVLLALCRP